MRTSSALNRGLLLLLFLPALTAEEALPRSDAPLVLPGMVLSVEEGDSPSFPAPLPRPADLVFTFPGSGGEGPLPSPPVPVFDPPLPRFLFEPPQAETAEKTENGLVVEGSLGAGSMNRLLGSISLTRTRPLDELAFLFSHEGLDGFDFRDPGTGYFRREEKLAGRGTVKSASLDFDFRGSFYERETGLQGLPVPYSVVDRFLAAGFSPSFRITDSFVVKTEAALSAMNRFYTETENDVFPDGEEYSAAGSFEAGYYGKHGRLFLDGRYRCSKASDFDAFPEQRIEAGAGGLWNAAEGMSAEGRAGLAWNDEQDLWFPFSLTVKGRSGEVFSFTLAGGRRLEERTLARLLTEEPFLGAGGGLPDGRTWFGGAEAKIGKDRGPAALAVSFFAENREDALVAGDYSPASASFPVTLKDRLVFPASVGFSYKIEDGLRLESLWTFRPGERSLFEPLHELSFSAGLDFVKGRAGVESSARATSDDKLPELDFRGFFKPLQELRLSLSVEDALSPLLDNGRYDRRPFIDPGFRVTLEARVFFH